MTDCRHRLPSPELAGRTTWEQLREDRKRYPHLRPCIKAGWNWIYRKSCEKCPEAIEEKRI